MKVTISSVGAAFSSADDTPIADRQTLAALDGVVFDTNGHELSEDFDDELLDRGIVGGVIHFSVTSGEICVVADYWSHNRLDARAVDLLFEFTASQWADGLGEGGFVVRTLRGELVVVPSERRIDATVTQVDDGVSYPGTFRGREGGMGGAAGRCSPSRSPRVGKLTGCEGGILDLHLAIKRGSVEICELLIGGRA